MAEVDLHVYTGLRSVANILRQKGLAIGDDELIKSFDLKDDVITWALLEKIVKKHKYDAQLLRPAPEELREVPVPALIRFKNGSFAMMGVNNDEAVFLYDPNRDKPVAMPMSAFIEVWSGEVLVIKTKLNWASIKRRYNLEWFYAVILHYKRFFGEILLASFFLQCMGLLMPLFTQVIVDKVISNQGFSTLTVLGSSMLLLCLVQSLLSALRTYLMNHTTNKVDAILGTRLFRHLISLPVPYYEHRRVGDTLMRVGALNSVREFLTGTTLTTLLDVVFSVVFIAFMLYYSPMLTLIALLVIPLYIVQNVWALPIYRRKIEAVWRTSAAKQSFLVEAVTGMQTMKALAVEPQFNKRWDRLLCRYVQSAFDSASFTLLVSSGGAVIQKISSLAVLWYGGYMVMAGEFSLGQLIAFQMISSQAIGPLTQLLGMWPNVQQTVLALDRLGDILHSKMEPVMLPVTQNLPALQGGLKVTDLSFRYRLDTPLALNQVSFTVKPGEKVGIVGRSGSGKSTLTCMLQKLYFPESGSITIDGQDLFQVDYGWLRRQTGVVMQDNYLFDGSIRDNIAMAKPTASMAEVIRAAELAAAHEFILELDEGYDTKVGERGAGLSGGQRQRIAIARALLTDPRLLIFDEATSALDYESERLIMKNLEQIAGDRTMLIIAHRIRTVEKCDKIIVMEQGRIAEYGSHEELLTLNGIYKNLYEQQEVGK